MNPGIEGYDLEESLAFYKKQLEQAIKHAKQAVTRNATVEEMSALGAKMRHHWVAIACIKIVIQNGGGKNDEQV